MEFQRRARMVALRARNGFQDKQWAIQGEVDTWISWSASAHYSSLVLTVVIFLDAEPYAEFHDIHCEYDEEWAALRFPGREHYPSSGHNSWYSILHSVLIIIFRNRKDFRLYVDKFTLQIENEYGDYYEQAYAPGGKPYAMWAASMAVAQNTGVPWIMCQESDAPDPVVSFFTPEAWLF